MGRDRIRQPVVKTIDEEAVKSALLECPEIVQRYVKSLEELVKVQRQSQVKALAKIRELSNTNK